ncbi:MAG: hypothetical protein NC122_00180 [Faecalibacterium sp.]|nr:hypothetical protein [Ruminococcus sp.]MCM1391397.1 hypothetical protein [Ruminococcus sp.]MCM1484607.1 hypothetical protein [Faecalibacterium sp.]
MIINIKNNSSMTAIINYGGKDIKLSSRKSISLTIDKNNVHLAIRPKLNTKYSKNRSHFTILTEYDFDNQETVTLNLDYQSVMAKNDAWHIYYRMVDTCGCYDAKFSIVPPEKKSTFGIDLLVNFPLTILFNGFAVLIISIIIGVIFESLKLGIIAFFVMVVLISLYEVLEDKVLDNLFDKVFGKHRSKKHGKKQYEMPLYFDECSKSDYIKYCFDCAKK